MKIFVATIDVINIVAIFSHGILFEKKSLVTWMTRTCVADEDSKLRRSSPHVANEVFSNNIP